MRSSVTQWDSSPYVSVPAVVERVARLTELDRLFRIAPETPLPTLHRPGQFLMAGLPGYGEAPFSISSPPEDEGGFELCIRAVGNLTRAIHRLTKGDRLWIRGPYGRGFPVDELKGRNLLFIAGGIGIVPMRSLIKTVLARRDSYRRLTLLYGIKSPEEKLFGGEMEQWSAQGLECLVTVDRPQPRWHGHVGVVTTLIPPLDIDEDDTTAVVIGPPVMYKYVILSLGSKRLRGTDIFLSLERRMRCGVGKCGHCQINSVYTCQEGPVFRLSEIRHLREAV